MEIFNVNRQAYQHLGRMTYANLPSPSTVPEGTVATIYGWQAPDADWVVYGGYWVPRNGRAVVHAPVLVNAQAQTFGTTLVASVPAWTVPAGIANTPRLFVEVNAECTLTSPSNAAYRRLYCGNAFKNYLVGGIGGSNLNDSLRLWGKTSRKADGQWQAHGENANPLHQINSGTDTVSSANFAASPIGLYYSGGNPDASEILNIHSFTLSVGVG